MITGWNIQLDQIWVAHRQSQWSAYGLRAQRHSGRFHEKGKKVMKFLDLIFVQFPYWSDNHTILYYLPIDWSRIKSAYQEICRLCRPNEAQIHRLWGIKWEIKSHWEIIWNEKVKNITLTCWINSRIRLARLSTRSRKNLTT